MDMQPFFSVIVPAYNIAEYLPFALGSLISQTFTDWECICVNDGSSDDTAQILCTWASRDHRIRVINGSHGGVSAARNMAIDVANGEYIIFLDGDDMYVSNAFNYLAGALARYNYPDVLTYGFTRVEKHCNNVKADEGGITETKFNLFKQSELNEALNKTFGGLTACFACWRRDTVGHIRFDMLPNGEDVLWSARCLMEAKTVCCSTICLYRYLKRPGSAVRVVSKRHAISSIKSAKRMAESAAEWARKDEVATVIFRRILSMMLGEVRKVCSMLSMKDKRDATKVFVDALRYLCRDAGLLRGAMAIYFRLAVRNPLSRTFMLYLPFDFYELISKGRR